MNKLQSFHNRFCHDCFFFCVVISKKRNYWTQSILKKKWEKTQNKPKQAQILPWWAEHLQASAIPAKNYKKRELQTRMLTPRLSSHTPCYRLTISPPVKWGYEYFHYHLQFPCIYTLIPCQCYGYTKFYRKKKTTQRNIYLQNIQIPAVRFLETLNCSLLSTMLIVI